MMYTNAAQDVFMTIVVGLVQTGFVGGMVAYIIRNYMAEQKKWQKEHKEAIEGIATALTAVNLKIAVIEHKAIFIDEIRKDYKDLFAEHTQTKASLLAAWARIDDLKKEVYRDR